MDRKDRYLSDAQRFNWLRLWRSDNVGPVSFRQLINRFGSAEAALEALPGLIARTGGNRIYRIAAEDAVRQEFDLAGRAGIEFVAFGEPSYPEALKHAQDAPPIIAVHGRLDLLRRPLIAVVGSRNASTNGLKLAQVLARDLSDAGFPVISGLARGIDTAAHHGAMEGGTVAVLAGGPDQPYPPQNLDLHRRISEQGAVISAMPFGHVATARDFPRRNAIIAGAALAVVVVEAAERSGSLITASMANENGRFVLAAPGFPLDPRSAGCNRLIREGAILIRDAADVLEIVRPLAGAPPHADVPVPAHAVVPSSAAPASKTKNDDLLQIAGLRAETGRGETAPRLDVVPVDRPELDPVDRVLALLGDSPVAIDDLIRDAGLAVAVVHASLTDLELSGKIERQSGGTVLRIAF